MHNHAFFAWLRLSRLLAKTGKAENFVDFFFYCRRQDDANNLALDLFNLGYTIHGVHSPDKPGKKWLITGQIQRSIDDGDWVEAWLEKMEQLAKKHGGEFDGMGTAIDLPDEIKRKLKSGELSFDDL